MIEIEEKKGREQEITVDITIVDEEGISILDSERKSVNLAVKGNASKDEEDEIRIALNS